MKRNILACSVLFAVLFSAITPIKTLANPPWFGEGCNTTYTGPDGIKAGSYSPQSLTQEQRQWLFEVFGHNGIAPDGYGGEDCNGSNVQPTQQPTLSPWFGQGCGTSYTGPGGIRAGSYSPQDLSQEQRQWLFEVFGHNGIAPDGYGGENCTIVQPTSLPVPTQTSAPSQPDWFGQGCGTSYKGPGDIRAGSYSPQAISQDQRQWLFEVFGHNGIAPVGYGGEACSWQTPSLPSRQPPTAYPTIAQVDDESVIPSTAIHSTSNPSSTQAFTPSPQSQGKTCFEGSYIIISDGHHLVVFRTGQENARHANWEITKKPWVVEVAEVLGGEAVISGPANPVGDIQATFPWKEFLPWNLFFSPTDFSICIR